MRRMVCAAVALCVAALVLTGCVQQRFSVITSAGVTAVVNNDSTSGMDALVSGSAVVANGCWAIRGETGELSPVAWPPGTQLKDGELVLPDSEGPISDGDTVELSGGELPTEGLSVPDQPCWSEGDVVIVLSS